MPKAALPGTEQAHAKPDKKLHLPSLLALTSCGPVNVLLEESAKASRLLLVKLCLSSH